MTSSKHTAHTSLRGLTAIEVEASRKKNGSNTFTGQKRKSLFRKYLESFGDPIIKILLIALLVNVFFAIQSGDRKSVV